MNTTTEPKWMIRTWVDDSNGSQKMAAVFKPGTGLFRTGMGTAVFVCWAPYIFPVAQCRLWALLHGHGWLPVKSSQPF